MSSWVEAAIGYQKDDFQQTCDCCGAVFQVTVPGQKGHEEPEEYYCPECSKEYKCRASNSPRVSLVSKRTDGLTGPVYKVSLTHYPVDSLRSPLNSNVR